MTQKEQDPGANVDNREKRALRVENVGCSRNDRIVVSGPVDSWKLHRCLVRDIKYILRLY
jgi:hypothetical protein